MCVEGNAIVNEYQRDVVKFTKSLPFYNDKIAVLHVIFTEITMVLVCR